VATDKFFQTVAGGQCFLLEITCRVSAKIDRKNAIASPQFEISFYFIFLFYGNRRQTGAWNAICQHQQETGNIITERK